MHKHKQLKDIQISMVKIAIQRHPTCNKMWTLYFLIKQIQKYLHTFSFQIGIVHALTAKIVFIRGGDPRPSEHQLACDAQLRFSASHHSYYPPTQRQPTLRKPQITSTFQPHIRSIEHSVQQPIINNNSEWKLSDQPFSRESLTYKRKGE